MNDFDERVLGCLLGGLIGDAMGSRTENLEPDEIFAAHGWVDTVRDGATDDSILKHLLCDAILATDGRPTSHDWAEQWLRQRHVFYGDQRPRFFVSVLQSATKLIAGYPPEDVATGNLPSSSSAMAIAPVGIVNSGDPVTACHARELAGLIHRDDARFCQDAAAAIAAATAVAMAGGDTAAVLDAAVEAMRDDSAIGSLALRSLEMAAASDYRRFRGAYHASFRQALACDPRETVPAALGLVRLADGDPLMAIPYGANFGRDTDTIATMAGSICGAMAGVSGLRLDWIYAAEAMSDRNQRELARALASIAAARAAERQASGAGA